MLKIRTIWKAHFYIALIAMAIGCVGAMNTQEDFMSDMRYTGVCVAFAFAVWLPTLLPNRSLKFELPSAGIIAFLFLMGYTVIMLVFANDEMTPSNKITRLLFHGCFVVSLIGTYRWYSFNRIEKPDTYAFIVIFMMLLLMYVRVVFVAMSNLNLSHLATSYYTLYALPLVLFHKSWRWKALCIILTFIAVFTSMKRGGALALVFGLMVYLYVYLRNRSFNMLKTTAIFIVSLAFITAIVIFLGSNKTDGDDQMNLIERIENVQEDGGSNRDHVYTVTWHLITSQNMGSLLVGNGYNAVLRDSPIHFSAHNDFMEITYDYGLIGLMCYIIFTFSFMHLALKAYRHKLDMAPNLCFQFSNFILLSNISHIFIYMYMPLVLMTYGIGKGQMRLLHAEEMRSEQ